MNGELLGNIISLVVYILPVLSLFCKFVSSNTKIQEELRHLQVKMSELEKDQECLGNSKNILTINGERIENHEERLDKLEAKVESIQKDITEIKATVAETNAMVKMLIK